MRLCDIRLCQAAMLVLMVAGTGCAKAVSSASPDQARAAAAGLAPVAASSAEVGPSLPAALTAVGAFPLVTSSPAAQGSPHAIPGTDAVIQRWFLDNGARKVRFNDALLQTERAVASG